MSWARRIATFLTLIAVGLVLLGAYIQSDPDRSIPTEDFAGPEFIGAPATARPVLDGLARPVVQHPFLAPAGVNSMHNDAAQSDAYRWAGPLGRDLEVSSQQFHRIVGSCVAQTFDSKGRMIGTCVTPFGVTLVARDPDTLAILARHH